MFHLAEDEILQILMHVESELDGEDEAFIEQETNSKVDTRTACSLR